MDSFWLVLAVLGLAPVSDCNNDYPCSSGGGAEGLRKRRRAPVLLAHMVAFSTLSGFRPSRCSCALILRPPCSA